MFKHLQKNFGIFIAYAVVFSMILGLFVSVPMVYAETVISDTYESESLSNQQVDDISVNSTARYPFPMMPLSGDSPNLKVQPQFPNNVSRSQMNADVIAQFNKIEQDFRIEQGTGQTNDPDNFLMVLLHNSPTGGGGGPNTITCSESMGYGMLMAAYLAGAENSGLNTRTVGGRKLTMKDYFDGMHRTHAKFPTKSGPAGNQRLIAWQITHNGSEGGWADTGTQNASSATDGDLDMAYAYLLAHMQWGSTGKVNYLKWAQDMIEDIWVTDVDSTTQQYATPRLPFNYHLKIGNWAQNWNANQYTTNVSRPSDYMLNVLNAFNGSVVGDSGNSVKLSNRDWKLVIDATMDAIGQGTDPALRGNSSTGSGTPDRSTRNGLLPGFMYLDRDTGMWRPSSGEWYTENGANDRRYDYNACRVPWRLSTQIILHGDSTVRYKTNSSTWNNTFTLRTASVEPALHFMLRGAAGNGGANNVYGNMRWQHYMDGSGSSQWGGSAFASPIAVSASLYGTQQEVNNGWNYMKNLSRDGYNYADYINVLTMLTASGNIWCPTTVGDQPAPPTPTPTPTEPTPTPTPSPSTGPVVNERVNIFQGIHVDRGVDDLTVPEGGWWSFNVIKSSDPEQEYDDEYSWEMDFNLLKELNAQLHIVYDGTIGHLNLRSTLDFSYGKYVLPSESGFSSVGKSVFTGHRLLEAMTEPDNTEDSSVYPAIPTPRDPIPGAEIYAIHIDSAFWPMDSEWNAIPYTPQFTITEIYLTYDREVGGPTNTPTPTTVPPTHTPTPTTVPPTPTPTPVGEDIMFIDLWASETDTGPTESLVLVLEKAIPDLSANDITVTGATKGILYQPKAAANNSDISPQSERVTIFNGTHEDRGVDGIPEDTPDGGWWSFNVIKSTDPEMEYGDEYSWEMDFDLLSQPNAQLHIVHSGTIGHLNLRSDLDFSYGKYVLPSESGLSNVGKSVFTGARLLEAMTEPDNTEDSSVYPAIPTPRDPIASAKIFAIHIDSAFWPMGDNWQPIPYTSQFTITEIYVTHDGGSVPTPTPTATPTPHVQGVPYILEITPTGEDYSDVTVTIEKAGYNFIPASRTVQVRNPGGSDPVVSFVTRIYQNVLEREPDPDGLAFWVNGLKSGGENVSGVIYEFFLGTEFLSKDISDDQFINIAYRTFMNREPDPDGLTHWRRTLASNYSRRYVVERMISDVEFSAICQAYGMDRGAVLELEGFVARMYRIVLGRRYEQSGLDYWIHQLSHQTQSGVDMAVNFFLSDEFERRNLSSSELVTVLFNTFLNRDPEPEAREYYENHLNNGTSLLDVMVDVIDSLEFIKTCHDYGIVHRF